MPIASKGCSREFGRFRRALLAIGLVAISSIWSAQSGVAQAATCESPSERSEPPLKVVSLQTEHGSEITEHYGNSVYSVTRCDATGNLLVSQTVAPIKIPGGGEKLVPFTTTEREGDDFVVRAASYGDAEEPYWAAKWQKEGRKAIAAVIAPTPENGEASISTNSSPDALTNNGGSSESDLSTLSVDKCTNNSWSHLFGSHTTRRHAYLIYWLTIPQNGKTGADGILEKLEGQHRINDGHGTWNNTTNNCGYHDQHNIVSWQGGYTALYPGSSVDDEISAIGFGSPSDLGCSFAALSCTRLEVTMGILGGIIRQADTIFDLGGPWYFGASGYSLPSNKYDLMSFAQHEAGHRIGLGDVFGTCHLVMGAACEGVGEWTRRWMGIGDVTSLRNKYPSNVLAAP